MHGCSEQAARSKRREEQRAGQREHDDLRTQPGALPVREEYAEGRGEAERRMVQADPERQEMP